MSRLWDRGTPLDERIERFTVGRDPELDLRILPFDALASMAHARMLTTLGILPEDALEPLRAELAAVVEEARGGRFRIPPDLEDGHTALENRLTERLGDAGRRIHTGRSRNDQVIAALRLWGREALVELGGSLLDAVDALLELAERHREVPLPGYSHTRQAMPSTVGFLFWAHAEALLDDLPWLETALTHLDRSPLGSASGFGVPLPLDRELVRDLLGFERLQVNTLAVQNDRGKSEYLTLSVAAAIGTDLGRLAVDLIFFSSEESGCFGLADAVTTGSSIMPQKRNPDVLELIRAGAARLRARASEVGGVYGPLASGYHRDLQATKEPFLEGLAGAADMTAATLAALTGLEVDAERCRQAVQPTSAATDALYGMVRDGKPFRDAYREVAAHPAAAVGEQPSESWRRRDHTGAPGAFDVGPLRDQARAWRERLAERREVTSRAWKLLDPPTP